MDTSADACDGTQAKHSGDDEGPSGDTTVFLEASGARFLEGRDSSGAIRAGPRADIGVDVRFVWKERRERERGCGCGCGWV